MIIPPPSHVFAAEWGTWVFHTVRRRGLGGYEGGGCGGREGGRIYGCSFVCTEVCLHRWQLMRSEIQPCRLCIYLYIFVLLYPLPPLANIIINSLIRAPLSFARKLS